MSQRPDPACTEARMDGSARRRPSWRSRRLLLLALVLGVAGMHTLGHLEHGGPSVTAGHGEVMHRRDLAPVPSPPSVSEAESALMSSPATEAAGGRRMSGTGDDLPGPDPSSVCLAVLTALVAVSLGAARVRRRASQAAATARPSSSPVARPPPDRTALRLARLSVLRI
ncbi:MULTISPECIES: DUF6153 family protein [Streptosporangium]|uniref:Uncharacterized protein n=1 Tax=Streptosporangium brasiliense TaxID=47480 RepID=A0ABT9R6X0_9ACTN|nr:DUF6153 family protein [Streptosporangium brasiliense]MDP9864145.1 hypothetical protein [Streptosporangium brasiliense]